MGHGRGLSLFNTGFINEKPFGTRPDRRNIMETAVIEVENLTKRYGDVEALRGVSFLVSEGEVFGLLGPIAAGKTRTVEIFEALRTPDSVRVGLSGLDPQPRG